MLAFLYVFISYEMLSSGMMTPVFVAGRSWIVVIHCTILGNGFVSMPAHSAQLTQEKEQRSAI